MAKLKKWYELLPAVGERARIAQQVRIDSDKNAQSAALFNIVDAEQLAAVTGWLAAGRGLRRWTCVEITALPRPDSLTPGDAKTPHWSVADAGELLPQQIRVEHRVDVAVPIEWYPGCHKCKDSKVRTVQEMANIWEKTYAEALADMQKPDWAWGSVTDGTYPCNYCQGTGYICESFLIHATCTVRRGFSLSANGKRNALDMCCRLQEHFKLEPVVSWDWEGHGDQKVAVKFFSVWSEWLSEYLARQPAGEGEQHVGTGG